MKKTFRYFVYTCLLVLLVFGLTYIPHKVVKIDPSDVSKITIFNGGTGEELEVTNQATIKHLVSNLTKVTFQKGKPSLGYMGYSFRTTFYDYKGKRLKELIINSDSRIRYKGFFYSAKDKSIDYHYIENMFKDK